MRVSALNIFPLKSGRGVSLRESPIDAWGLGHDRRWMVTDPSGTFITQRQLPKLAQVSATPGAPLTLTMDGHPPLTVALPPVDDRMDVTIWDQTVSAAVADNTVNDALSAFLGRPVKLVHFDEMSRRTASADWAGPGTPVAFGDGYQILVTTTGSLAALNADMAAHGEEPVGMDRFRANVVIDHDAPFAEDGWGSIEIGGVVLYLVKPCARCIMTTQDQQTGSREGASPMPAMGRIRMSADRRVPGPLFGWNAVPVGSGMIAVGDAAKVLDRRETWPLKRR
jgi:uncharacterized protein